MTTTQQPRGTLGADFSIRDPQRLAANMARLAEAVQTAVTAYLQLKVWHSYHSTSFDDLMPVTQTFAHVQRAWLVQPMTIMSAQAMLWQSYVNLWSSSMLQLMG